jgi:hypothetical protein
LEKGLVDFQDTARAGGVRADKVSGCSKKKFILCVCEEPFICLGSELRFIYYRYLPVSLIIFSMVFSKQLATARAQLTANGPCPADYEDNSLYVVGRKKLIFW